MSPPNGSAGRGDPRAWPRGAPVCIWMEAGLVAYKLCDRDYDCETCPFDAVMRGDGSSTRAPLPPVRSHAAGLPVLPRAEFPPDRAYHPAHTWAQARDVQRLRIGIDATAARLADRMTGVVLPVCGQRIEGGKVGAWILDETGPLAIHMPAAGHVIELNPALNERPRLAVEQAYDAGWLIEIACPAAAALAGLLSADQMAERASAESTALRERAAALAGGTIGTTLLDGGLLHPDLRTVLGPAAYRALVQPILAGVLPAQLSAR